MLNTPISSSHSVHNRLPLHNPFVGGATANNRSSSAAAYSPTALRLPNPTKKSNTRYIPAGNIRAIAFIPSLIPNNKTTSVKAVISVQPTITDALSGVNLDAGKDLAVTIFGATFSLELFSVDLDSNGNQKAAVKDNARYIGFSDGKQRYECDFDVPNDFGDIGAVLVENNLSSGRFFKTIVLDNNITFTCDSWVHSSDDNPDKRIFFTDKSYLPPDTPDGLKSLRTEDLESLRGNGQGKRKSFERIYDYDVYNDLGSPDSSVDLARPVLGGQEHPYPRRCRTGREMTTKDPLSESRTVLPFYVPRDEDFSEIKDLSFGARGLYSVLHAVVPTIQSVLTGKDKGFSLFTDINLLYNEGINIPDADNGLLSILPNLIKDVSSAADSVIKFETPEIMDRDTFAWSRDEEFCREMLAGINPHRIQLVTE
ncbi:hypothetical protein L6452_24056 [Arctium lappa]|uniref:Uncharacterized protein n=1 Tax=Arctium lappa TaxID=4217 RepID=A0ACB9A8Q5_ARCLA|nr:hypothetical protein L6452_24056 [Arctium lappa]